MTPSRFAAKAASLSLALLCGFGVASSAHAGPMSYTGTFAADNQLEIFNLNITSPTGGTINARTFSYSGGVNAAGSAVASGGFAPVLSLFDGIGDLVFEDRGSSHACGGPTFCWDAFFSLGVLSAGDYTLVLSQDENTSLGSLGAGFAKDSVSNYFNGFLGFDGQRTANWALDIDVSNNAVPTASVPEPAGGALVATALAALALTRRRRTV